MSQQSLYFTTILRFATIQTFECPEYLLSDQQLSTSQSWPSSSFNSRMSLIFSQWWVLYPVQKTKYFHLSSGCLRIEQGQTRVTCTEEFVIVVLMRLNEVFVQKPSLTINHLYCHRQQLMVTISIRFFCCSLICYSSAVRYSVKFDVLQLSWMFHLSLDFNRRYYCSVLLNGKFHKP